MKRFYTAASTARTDRCWAVRLDERAVKTPARHGLQVPARALAEAIADEWNAQAETIDPAAMPLTGLANAAIDHVQNGDRPRFLAEIAAYGETDLLCYRAEAPDALARQQAEAWDPLLDWAAEHCSARLSVTRGVMHVAQPPEACAALRAQLLAHSDFALAALQPLTSLSGSLVIALALAAREIDAEAAFRVSTVDERFQAEKWGDDAEALSAREARLAAFLAAARFLSLSDSSSAE